MLYMLIIDPRKDFRVEKRTPKSVAEVSTVTDSVQVQGPGQDDICVLLVDDEPELLRCVQRLLGQVIPVDVAGSAEEAVRLLARRDYAAVITDYDMPGEDGIWLLHQVSRRRPSVRRVLHSGSHPRNLEQALMTGVVHEFVPKPASRRALIGSLALVEA